ncbi:MAG: YceI family protein [Candidatus Dormibacteraeota bacterium]|nr:YceI family protein [Candidatus Dormibacteraeota bacterium]MBV9524485.1 YceI family protein [Candidatus Dormibacteraeota bacterium]
MSWTLDPAHTAVAFSAKHLGVATVRGRFTKVEADLELDNPEDPSTARGTVTIDARSIDTGNEQRDGHLRNADFLDVDNYPTITFTVRSVEPDGDVYRASGDLTIRGVTKPVTLEYEHSGVVTDPFGNTKVGGTLTGAINRTDWGLNWNVPLGGGGLLVSEKVKLEIDGELAEAKEAVAESADAEAQATA